MQSGVEVVDAQGISPQRKAWARDIALILWQTDLNSLPVMRQVTCHSIAAYTEKMLNAHSRDEEPRR
jgi:hypothetical protein